METELKDQVLYIRPEGPRIGFEKPEALDALRESIHSALSKDAKGVVINLENVNFIDSPGLGVFITGRLELRKKCEVHLCGLFDNVEKIIQHTQMNLLFPVHASEQEAHDAIASPANTID